MSKLRKEVQMPRYFELPEAIQVMDPKTGKANLTKDPVTGVISEEPPLTFLAALHLLVFDSKFIPAGRPGSRIVRRIGLAIKAAEAKRKAGEFAAVCMEIPDWDLVVKIIDTDAALLWNQNLAFQLEPFWECFDKDNAPDDITKLKNYAARVTPTRVAPVVHEHIVGQPGM